MQQFRIASHACFKAEYIDNGREMIMGYCGDMCPAIFKDRECIYQEGTENYLILREFTGMANAISVCCCNHDFCNHSKRLTPSIIFYIIIIIILIMPKYLN